MNNYNGKNKNFNNKPRMTDEEYAAHKAQLIEKQTKSLDIINDTCHNIKEYHLAKGEVSC